MKALIVNINAKYVHAGLAPWYLKAAALAAGTDKQGWEIEVLESNINRPSKETAGRILAAKPRLLAFCCYIWNMKRVEEVLAELAGRLENCAVALGGPEVGFDGAERLAELPAVDFILCGEGEENFPRLLAALAGVPVAEVPEKPGDPFAAIPGLCYRRGGGVLANPAAEAQGQPPDPYTAEFLARLEGRIVYLETSRGCPFSCSFCLSGRPGNTRFFSLERAKEQILLLANSGSKTVKLVDRTFNCEPRRAAEIIRFILERSQAADAGVTDRFPKGQWIPQGICFHFEAAADLFREDSLDLLARAPAGLFQLEIGLQSFREDTLAAVARKTDLAKVEENFRRLLSFGNMHLHLDLIAGLPGEDNESFGRSFDRAFALRPHMLQLGFLKLLRGSRLREEAARNGMVYDARPPYTVQSTAWLSAEELKELKLCEDALDRLYNSGRFPRTVEYLLAASGLRPFCLFSRFGRYTGNSAGMSLERYVSLLYGFGCGLEGTERDKLRDMLVQDWLAGNNTGRLPKALQIPDIRYRLVSLALEKLTEAGEKGKAGEKETAGEKGKRETAKKAAGAFPGEAVSEPAGADCGRPGLVTADSRRGYGFGLLYGGDQVMAAVADYSRPRAFLGGYPLRLTGAEALCAAAEKITATQTEDRKQPKRIL